MNLLLLTPEDHLEAARYVVRDHRAQHMREVLGVALGDRLRAGLLNGPRGEATVAALDADRVELELELEPAPPPRPDVDLLLGLPRPRSLKKLLPEVTALGVGRIVLTETARVEKAFFGATFLKPEVHRPLLLEGLMQGKLTHLPEITVERKLWRVLKSVPERFAGHRRLVAHPDAKTPLAAVELDPTQPVLLAIGPEGGFLDQEIDEIEAAGFEPVSIGAKILRVETACVALMAQVDLLRQQAVLRES